MAAGAAGAARAVGRLDLVAVMLDRILHGADDLLRLALDLLGRALRGHRRVVQGLPRPALDLARQILGLAHHLVSVHVALRCAGIFPRTGRRSKDGTRRAQTDVGVPTGSTPRVAAPRTARRSAGATHPPSAGVRPPVELCHLSGSPS